jgi:hypothetical protein
MLWSCPGVWAQEKTVWGLEKDVNRIQCYTRTVKGSNFKEFKAVTEIQSTLSGLVALVADMQNAPEWIDTCIEGRLLKQIAVNETMTYSVNEAPWPVSDRDTVVHNRVSQDSVTRRVTITMEGKPTFIPDTPDRLRIKHLIGFWQFTPKPNGIVSIHYQVHCEPGGHLPSWLVNAAVVDQPYKTLLNMRTYVLKKRYQHQRYPFIKEVND